jgi:hypothetical protein
VCSAVGVNDDILFSSFAHLSFLKSIPDVPWLKVNFKGPAVVQLSVVDSALVLQLVRDDGVPCQDATSLLLDIMANPSILLTGVGLDLDILELTRYWGPDVMATANVCGRFDIGGIGAKLGQTVSIKTLAKAVLGVELVKSRKIAISNWGKVPLTNPQIAYAARDAWTSAAVLHELAQRDPSTYSTESLLKLVAAQELPLLELDQRAMDRKKAKLQYLDIVGRGDDKRRRHELSEDERIQMDQLEAIMKELAPPRPFEFDVRSLGLEL